MKPLFANHAEEVEFLRRDKLEKRDLLEKLAQAWDIVHDWSLPKLMDHITQAGAWGAAHYWTSNKDLHEMLDEFLESPPYMYKPGGELYRG